VSFSVRWVESAARIDAALWEACFAPPLEGRWWYAALEQSGLGDQFQFLYALIQRDSTPVGIAPAFLMDLPVALVAPAGLAPLVQWLRPRTLFVGSPCADEGTVGTLPDVERAGALRALQHALERKVQEVSASLLVWKDFADSDRGDLEALALEAGLFPVVSFPGTIVTLEGGRDAYFAALKASRRHILKKKLRRSAERADLRAEVVQQPDKATLDAVFALFWQTYERAETRFERLNRRFFELIARAPQSHFVLLRETHSGELVAFMLCFELGRKVINKFIGIDYRRPREWLLYFRLWDAALDWALARGARAIQSGQTGYAPKIETGHRLVPLTNYCAHRNPLVHALARLCARRIDWSTLDHDLARFLRAHAESNEGPASRA
jgi:hypothetical protein